MPVKSNDVLFAFEYVSGEDVGLSRAWLNRETGETHCHSSTYDHREELPDDIDDEKYVSIPHR